MDEFFLLITLVAVFIGVPALVAYLLYKIPLKLGYPRAGKNLLLMFGLLVFGFILYVMFEDLFFTRSDAQKAITEQGFNLKDKFKLTTNTSSSAIGDYYHTFTIRVSAEDKSNAINQIVRSGNFTRCSEVTNDLMYTKDCYTGPILTRNYETVKTYVHEYFKPNGDGYAPTFIRISVNKDGLDLVFEDIDE